MKVLSGILVAIVAMICVLITGGIIASACYNPLKESERKSLFKSAKMYRKDKSEDLIKLSIHGESFDIFRYKTKDVILGDGYPEFDGRWDGEDLKEHCVTSMWKETPVHKKDSSLVHSIIDVNMVGATSKLQKEIAALCDSNGNFYCYIQNGSSNYYLFVYSPKNNYLYYTRVKNITLTDCDSHLISNFTDTSYWENLSPEEKKEVTDKVKRSKSIVANYVQNTFTVGDNNQTDSLLSVLSKLPSNGEVKCLYFHLFNDIAIKSDGALAEMVGEYVKPMLLSDVDYVLTYIMDHKEYYTLYTSMLAENLYLKGADYDDSIRLFNQFRLELTTNPITDRKSGDTFCESVKSRITELWNE